MGIFEVYRLREEDSDLILRHADEHTLRRHIRRHGTLSLLEDDLHKVEEGVITLAEIRSIAGLSSYTPRSLDRESEGKGR